MTPVRKLKLDWEKRGDKKVYILGVGVSGTELVEVLEIFNWQLAIFKPGMRPFFVVTVNPEFIMLAQKDPEFKQILNSAGLAIPDGAGLKLAGLKTIVPGRRLVLALIKLGYRIFYLGGRGNVAAQMARKFGGGSDPGHTNIKTQILNSKSQINLKILNKINKYAPDILLVAYGAPWQEKWLFANLSALNSKVVMGVGGTFDYLVGDAQLPPKAIERYGLEWLWRLLHEPWRWRRQLALVRYLYELARANFYNTRTRV